MNPLKIRINATWGNPIRGRDISSRDFTNVVNEGHEDRLHFVFVFQLKPFEHGNLDSRTDKYLWMGQTEKGHAIHVIAHALRIRHTLSTPASALEALQSLNGFKKGQRRCQAIHGGIDCDGVGDLGKKLVVESKLKFTVSFNVTWLVVSSGLNR